MSTYVVITDAGASIPSDLCRELGLTCIPMDYMLNGESLRFSPDQEDAEQVCASFYDALREGASVSTSQIPPFTYHETFGPILASGKDILYCCFSSGLSATWQVALMAAQELTDQYPGRTIRCVDTRSAAAGQGMFVQRAMRNQAAGMDLEANARDLEESSHQCCHWFSVWDLDFLKRGGRISPTVAFFGTKMNIKPILQVDTEGKLVVTDKVRGQAASMTNMVKKMQKAFDPVLTDEFWMDHAGAPDECQTLAKLVQEAIPGAVVRTVPLSPIIGAHTGPGMLSLCCYGSHR